MDSPDKIPESGAVFMFGRSKFAQSRTSRFWLKGNAVTSASCGDEHTVLLTQKGKVYVFGSNNWGQLGLSHTQAVEKPTFLRSLANETASMVACGRNHTLVATADDKVFGFGNNGDFQLGIPTHTNCDSPVEITSIPKGKIKKLAAGAEFSALLLENGALYVWGSNSLGELGLQDIDKSKEPVRLNVSEEIISVACGYYHTAVATKTGKLYTFGENEFGKLGKIDSDDCFLPSEVTLPSGIRVNSVACGGSHTAFMTSNGKLFTFGGGYHGELGHGEDSLESDKPMQVESMKDKKVTDIYCGENFTCVITDNGKMYSFGDGRGGKLGLDSEDFSNQFSPVLCKTLDQYSVKSVACGGCHTIAVVKYRDTNSNMMVDAQGLGDNFKLPELQNLDISETQNDNLNLSLRSSIAREKRRKAREISPSKTLPSLSTLKSDELLEAVKSFPKVSHHDIPTSFNATKLELDQTSDISVLNTVHRSIKADGNTTFVPVKHSKTENIDSGGSEEEISDSGSQSLPKDSTEPVALHKELNVPSSSQTGQDSKSQSQQVVEEDELSDEEYDYETESEVESKTMEDERAEKTIDGKDSAEISADGNTQSSNDQENKKPSDANNPTENVTAETPEDAKSQSTSTADKAKDETSNAPNAESSVNETDQKPMDTDNDQSTASATNANKKNSKKSKFCTIL